MRTIQFRILNNLLDKVEIPEYIYAFERGKSIPKMAQSHVGKGTVLSFDLKDFFTSIKQQHLFQIFQHLGCSEKPARLLSELCTIKSFVPQGALTSPKLSNIVTALTFGPKLKEYCDQRGYTLSIYADDITISMDEVLDGDRMSVAIEIMQYVSNLVQSFRFEVNHRKTKVMRPYQRQFVCGVVVNVRPNLKRTEKRKLRAVVHTLGKYGVEYTAAKNGYTPERLIGRLAGQIGWFGQLNPEAGARILKTFQIAQAHKDAKVTDGQDGNVKEVSRETSTNALIEMEPIHSTEPWV
jgi:RNA-directed DNA polymerase